MHDLVLTRLDAYDKKIGIALLILYCIQIAVGYFIHYVKLPGLFGHHRTPQNYFHAILGLAILALADYQVRTPSVLLLRLILRLPLR
jgi:hypothetical protein